MYTDPLHIPSASYTLWHNGKEALTLNKRLLDQQNCWTNVDKILELHSERLHLEDMMKEALDSLYNAFSEEPPSYYQDFLMLCDAYYTQIEFELQEQWGFTIDANFHRPWYRPGCSCPRMDNEERYGTPYRVTSGDCILHGYTAPPPTFWDKPSSILDKIVNYVKGVFNG